MRRRGRLEMEAELLKHGITFTGRINAPYSVIVPLSGGKDSQACLMLALAEHPASDVLALFCDTGFEHPITYQHIQEITNKHGVDLVTLSAGTVLSVCTQQKRFPGGGARHCTSKLKIRPAKNFYAVLARQQEQDDFQVWYGVRSDESPERKKRYRHKVSTDLMAPHEFMASEYPQYLEKMGVMFRLPIIDWSRTEVFEYLAGTGNPLYGKGFDRVGCFPCLAGGEGWQTKAFNFDETGRKHYEIAQQISAIAGRPVLRTNKYRDSGPGCAICEM